MTPGYKAYLDYLGSLADSTALAAQAETNIYPLFTDIRNLIRHYQSTIEKFPTVQKDLVAFVERMEFDEYDFDHYQHKFQGLGIIIEHLEELKGKPVAPKVADEIKTFIANIYNNTSLYMDARQVDEQVLAKINYTYDLNRSSGCLSVILLLVAVAALLSFTIIKY